MKINTHDPRLSFTILVAVTLSLPACNNQNEPPCDAGNDRGKLIEATLLNTFTIPMLNQLLDGSGLDLEATIENEIAVYKLVYQTIDASGEKTLASGALFIPRGKTEDGFPIVSVHHGTETKRDAVASKNPLLSFESILMASTGYVTCTPDYLGLGDASGLHPYLILESSATAVIDFLRAAKIFCCQNNIKLNDQLFLAGYSEGGYVTLAVQKIIEEFHADEFTVTASAPMAGPYDLVATAYDILNRDTYAHPAYFGYIFLTYNAVYGWDRLNDIFQSPYSDSLSALFDGTRYIYEIDASLSTRIATLFDSTFIADFLSSGEQELKMALLENSPLEWSPEAPTRFYHGDADITVPYLNAVRAESLLSANGGDRVTLITIPGGTHETAAVPAMEMALAWFDSLKQ
ncbi:MAG: alpha/beta hydrolase [FCB group bacterium]|nr:alpha/beta hydrolase [FCB group bacterium]